MSTSITAGREQTAAYRVLQRIFDEGFATGNEAIADEVCSLDLVDHQFGTAGRGAEAITNVKAAIRNVHEAVPDIRFSIEDWVQDGEVIWVRVRGQGTHTGPYFGPPSGRPVDFTVIDVCRVTGGLIAEHWGVPDRFAMMAQTAAARHAQVRT